MLDGFETAADDAIRDRLLATGPHPSPTDDSVAAAARATRLARDTHFGSCLVLLLSGGASAMLAAPAPGLTLEDKIAATREMLAAGLPIDAINTVRKHLSAVKGGWLAAGAAACCTLAISDVIGPAEDDLSVIGSGPGVPDPSTYADAVRALRAGGVWDAMPGAVRTRLQAGEQGLVPETPKPGDPRLARASGFVIGSRQDAMSGAAAAAARLGYHVTVHAAPTLGDARLAGPAVVARAFEAAAGGGPTCVISSGETTVHVRGPGRGGRNQELALAAVRTLGRAPRDAVLVSLGTDGVDGPTDAAGALVDRRTLARAEGIGLASPESVLEANDSHAFFDALGDLLRTGPTGTNVGDLQIVLVA